VAKKVSASWSRCSTTFPREKRKKVHRDADIQAKPNPARTRGSTGKPLASAIAAIDRAPCPSHLARCPSPTIALAPKPCQQPPVSRCKRKRATTSRRLPSRRSVAASTILVWMNELESYIYARAPHFRLTSAHSLHTHTAHRQACQPGCIQASRN